MSPFRMLPITALIVGLAACSTTSRISDLEAQAREVYARSDLSINVKLVAYGQQMAADYLRIADTNVLAQDLVSVSLIGLAAAGVLAAVDGASTETMATIGIGGLTLGAGARYFDLPGSAGALVTAAGQHLCISAVAASVRQPLDAERAAIVVHGYDRSRILLRRAQVRRVPTYAELVAEIGAPQGFTPREVSAPFIDPIQTAVDACFPKLS